MIKLRIDQKILKFFKTINSSFFIIFLIISCFFWIVTKFSNTYKIKNDFYINWINIPETIVLDDQQKKISILLSASGFEILLYKFFKDNIDLSLDKDVTYNNNIAQVNINKKMYEIENQLFENNKIEDLISKQISFKYSILSRKKVPVFFDENISFRPGYLNEDEFNIIPDSIIVIGPMHIIDTLKRVKTILYKKNDVYRSINEEIELLKLDNLFYNKNQVIISSIVKKYSEKEFKIPIRILNLPDSIKLKLFPNYVTLKAIISLDNYNNIISDDFIITTNYKLLNSNFSNLSLLLAKYPKEVKNINWYPKTVNYLIRK